MLKIVSGRIGLGEHASVSVFEIAALLLLLSGVFGWINLRFFRLPHTIGLLIMGLAGSLLLLAVHAFAPELGIVTALRAAIGQIDFYSAIMNGMLAFLLFAGALHVDFLLLKNQKWAIVLMASIGVVISTAITGFGLWGAALLFGVDLPLKWALVFGALISPTDPVAVLGLLKTVNVPDSIKAKVAGESLFNDGVAVVAFSLLLALALGAPANEHQEIAVVKIAEVLAYQIIGGAVLGLAAGWLAHRAMAAIDDHIIEILISLGACAATYALCHRLHMSGPIAVVVTGLLLGNHGVDVAMSEKVQEYMFAFWEVIDEILNSVLFLLIGLEVLVLHFDRAYALVMLAAIPIVLFGRLVSVALPISLLSFLQTFSSGSIAILTWGGLRGGVSVALALSLPDSDAKPVILSVTYAVVIFSIVVQGLTVKRVVEGAVRPKAADAS